MNVPVVAARTRIDEYYFTDKMVQFFDSGHAEDLADKILDLIQNPDQRSALCESSSEFITQNNWDVKKQGYLTLVDRLAMRTNNRPSLRELLRLSKS